MARIGLYDHMNKDEKLNVSLTIEELAQKIEQMNYGTHRFLSALVRIRRADAQIDSCCDCKMLTDGIEDLLNRGGF